MHDLVATNLKLFVIHYFFLVLQISVKRLIVRVSRCRYISWKELQVENGLNFLDFVKNRVLSEMAGVRNIRRHK